MDPEKRAKWPSHLGPILIAYNATRSLITGYSPYFLMFGCRPRLPVNLLFPTVRQDENSQTTDEYVMSLYDKLKSALASVRDTALLEAQRQKAALRPQGRGGRTTSGRQGASEARHLQRSMTEIEKPVGRCPLYSG